MPKRTYDAATAAAIAAVENGPTTIGLLVWEQLVAGSAISNEDALDMLDGLEKRTKPGDQLVPLLGRYLAHFVIRTDDSVWITRGGRQHIEHNALARKEAGVRRIAIFDPAELPTVR